jgi:hypothetical protein
MESIDNHRKWPININTEREFWHNTILNVFIIIPNECPYCHKGSINLRNNNSLVNPIIGKCNKYFCQREVYLHKGTIFEKNNKMPDSVLYKILYLWQVDELNVNKISKKLLEIYHLKNVERIIYNFISFCRIFIANYLKKNMQLTNLLQKMHSIICRQMKIYFIIWMEFKHGL